MNTLSRTESCACLLGPLGELWNVAKSRCKLVISCNREITSLPLCYTKKFCLHLTNAAVGSTVNIHPSLSSKCHIVRHHLLCAPSAPCSTWRMTTLTFQSSVRHSWRPYRVSDGQSPSTTEDRVYSQASPCEIWVGHGGSKDFLRVLPFSHLSITWLVASRCAGNSVYWVKQYRFPSSTSITLFVIILNRRHVSAITSSHHQALF
jgi:hypothetical protein